MMTSRKSIFATALGAAIVLALAGASTDALAKVTIGATDTIVRSVEGAFEGAIRNLDVADEVFQNEEIRTGEESAVQLTFLDGTTLAMGERSALALTTIIFNPDPSLGRVVIDVTVGVFKFASGAMNSTNYEIRTPVATIGIRGTVFTVVVAPDGTTTVAVEEGEVVITNRVGEASRSISAGFASTVTMGPDGMVLAPTSPGPPPYHTVAAIQSMLSTLAAAGAGPVEEGPNRLAETGLARGVTGNEVAAVAGRLNDGEADAGAWLTALFARTDGSPEEIAQVALSLIAGLEGDPQQLQAAIDMVSGAASTAMTSLPVYRVTMSDDFRLPEGARGWNFGSAGNEVTDFRTVTPEDMGLPAGAAGGGDGLFGEGISGVDSFSALVPDGAYRLIVLTGDGSGSPHPLGTSITFGSVTRPVSAAGPEDWLEPAALGAPQTASGGGSALASPAPGASMTVSASGGATMLVAQVSGGRMHVEIGTDGSAPTYITGMIIEPASGPTVLSSPHAMVLEEETDLAGLVIAEGGAARLGQATLTADGVSPRRTLDLPEPAVQDAVAVSDS